MNDENSEYENTKKYQGLGGWLILFAWIPLLGGLVTVPRAFLIYSRDFSNEHWVTAIESFPSLENYVLLAYAVSMVIAIAYIANAYTFLTRKRMWIKVFIVAEIIYHFGPFLQNFYAVYYVPPEVQSLITADELLASFVAMLIVVGITIAYVLLSKRVKNTFIN